MRWGRFSPTHALVPSADHPMLKLPWPFAPPTTPSPTSGYFSWHQLSSVVSLTLVLQQSLRLSGLTVLQEEPTTRGACSSNRSGYFSWHHWSSVSSWSLVTQQAYELSGFTVPQSSPTSAAAGEGGGGGGGGGGRRIGGAASEACASGCLAQCGMISRRVSGASCAQPAQALPLDSGATAAAPAHTAAPRSPCAAGAAASARSAIKAVNRMSGARGRAVGRGGSGAQRALQWGEQGLARAEAARDGVETWDGAERASQAAFSGDAESARWQEAAVSTTRYRVL